MLSGRNITVSGKTTIRKTANTMTRNHRQGGRVARHEVQVAGQEVRFFIPDEPASEFLFSRLYACRTTFAIARCNWSKQSQVLYKFIVFCRSTQPRA